jgi:hypothetical protein
MANPSFKRTFELVQHTPLIHFQRDTGATLRSTEVKAKLDSYLLSKANDEEKALLKKCLINPENNPDTGLDYKMHIAVQDKGERTPIGKNQRGEYPMFFANMGNEYKDGDRVAVLDGQLRVDIFSFHGEELLNIIDRHIVNFFATTNFGMRSTKGYGSFTVIGKKPDVKPKFSFTIATAEWKVAFQYVDLFYKSLRGGINGAMDPNTGRFVKDFYMKPLLFVYAHDNKVQWEKRTIKQSAKNLFPLYQQHKDKSWTVKDQNLTVHEAGYRVDANWPLWQSHTEKAIVRDVLGLSTDQSWRGYGKFKRGEYSATITKTPARGHQDVERFASPLIFKPILENDQFRIDVFVNREIPKEYLGAKFKIEVDGTDIGGEHPIWAKFDLDIFLRDYVKLSRLNAAIQVKSGDKNAEAIKKALVEIYKQINPQ